jgi:hypothetical protein
MVHPFLMLTDQSVINLLTRQSVAWSVCAYQLARLVGTYYGGEGVGE